MRQPIKCEQKYFGVTSFKKNEIKLKHVITNMFKKNFYNMGQSDANTNEMLSS